MDFDAKFEQNNQLFDAKFDDNGSSFDSNFGETNVVHSGKNGATFIPSVSEEGIISWTNDRNLENPSPVDIKGKSAYKYAQEGGYTGTEAEFAEKLADQSTLEYVTAGQKEGTKLGIASTAEGAQTTASGNQAHAEGNSTVASGDQAHAEGYETKATASAAHAEGIGTLADAQGAHAQGKFTKATGDASAANGYWTEANNTHQFVVGRVNENDPLNLFEVGGGAVCYDKDTGTFHEEQFDRFNVFEVSHDGQARAETLATKDTIFNRKDGATKDGVEYARWHNGTTGKVDPIVIPGAVASGFQSVAFGGQRIDKTLKAYTKNPEIPATEPQTQALGDQSFAAGGSVIVNGDWSAGFGKEAVTYQKAAFATGGGTQAGCTEDEYNLHKTYMHASGTTIPTYANSYSFGHAEGDSSKAIGRATHAEGRQTLAIGFCSHAEGDNTKAIGRYSHAEGYQSTTGTIGSNGKITLSASYAHAEGQGTKAYNTATHSEGMSTTANGISAHAEGYNTTAGILNRGVDADGKNIIDASHAEGIGTTASGIASHAEGDTVIASGKNSHAEGDRCQATATDAHAEGFYSKAVANYSHAEGAQSVAAGTQAHAEGYKTLAKGASSHAEGHSHNQCSSALAIETIKTNWESAKNFTAAVGTASHAEGLDTLAYGAYSRAGGSYSEAVGNNSFAHGDHVTASVANQAVFGKYNEEDADALFIIGNGTDTNNKNNAFAVKKDGTIVSDYLDSITKGFATEDYVEEKVAGIVDSSPETLNTLNELAKALGDDPNFATTVATEIGKKVGKDELNEVLNHMYGDDITGDGVPTIREISTDAANDLLAEVPLIGSTTDTTPAEVAEAIAAGRPISLTHVDPTFGTLVGNNSSITDNGLTVLTSCVVQAGEYFVAYELFGSIATGDWNSTYSVLADGEQVSGAFAEIAQALDNTSIALAGKVPISRTVNGKALDSNITLTKADIGLGNVDNTADKDKPLSTAQQSAINNSYDKIISRGEQLIVNGSGLMGDNTNFSSWEFDPSEANNSVGSFTITSTAYAQVFTDEPFPINPNLTYTLSIDAKSKNSTATIYSMLNFLDSDGLTIQAKDHMHSTSSTTTLAKDLKSGDRVIYFTDLSGWDVNLAYGFYLTIWNYKNSFGYTYPVGTYSRNRIVLPNINSLIDTNAIDFVNNTITLNKPYSGATIPANTPVSQGYDGASYKYIAIKWANAPTSWKTYTDNIGGVDYSGQNLSNKFPPGTAYATFGMLWNSNSAQDQVWITNVSLTANSVTGAATTIIKNDLSAGYALISNSSGKIGVGGATSTELGYLRGVTSNIQSQLNNKPTLAQVGTLIDEKLGVIENGSY